MLTARSLARVRRRPSSEVACRILGCTEALSVIFDYTPTADERELVEETLAVAATHIGDTASRTRAQHLGAQVSYTDLGTLLVPDT